MYETTHDVEQKLVSTIILYKGKPIWVIAVDSYCGESGVCELAIRVKTIPVKPSTKSIIIALSNPGLDTRGISSHLGYINSSLAHQAVWLSRVPLRKWKQGLSSENLYLSPDIIDFGSIVADEGLAAMVANTYPTMTDALALFLSMKPSVAIHKFFAIRKKPEGYILEYKGRAIGISETLGNFKLLPEYGHYQEIVEHYAIAV
jgi:hypothetical protein